MLIVIGETGGSVESGVWGLELENKRIKRRSEYENLLGVRVLIRCKSRKSCGFLEEILSKKDRLNFSLKIFIVKKKSKKIFFNSKKSSFSILFLRILL